MRIGGVPGPGKLGSGPRKMLMGSSGWEIEVQAGVGAGEVEMRAVRQGGGREERMRLRSARASRGREDLWRKASCTERKRSQERAMGVERSSREREVESGAELWKVSSRKIEGRDCAEGLAMRTTPSWRKAATEEW